MKGTVTIIVPTVDELAVKAGLLWNCKLCTHFLTYYTVYGMTESKVLTEMYEHWKEKHKSELSDLELQISQRMKQ